MDSKQLKTALLTIGTGAVSHTAYKTLAAHSDLQLVIFSQREKQVSRLKRVWEYGVWYTMQQLLLQWHNRRSGYRLTPAQLDVDGVAWQTWRDVGEETAVLTTLRQKEIDLLLISGCQFILKPHFFEQVAYCLNIHPSYLPTYRGPEPVVWGLLEQQSDFGITVHAIDTGIDTGDIVAQRKVTLVNSRLFYQIEESLAAQLPTMLKQIMVDATDGTIQRTPQSGGFYRPAPTVAQRRKVARQSATQTAEP